MNPLSCIIIDDEPKATKLLRSMIEELDLAIDIIAEYNDPELALKDVGVSDVDFLFLDIDMPAMTGFEFLEKLHNPSIFVVFVTGYNHFALKAIKFSAIDYIVKPISIDDLSEAIGRVRDRVSLEGTRIQNMALLENLRATNFYAKNLGIPSVDGIDFVRVGDILYCEGTDRYTRVALESGNDILSSYSLGEFTKLIGDAGFYQTHRSYLVNLTKITQYHKDGTLLMRNGSSVPLARRRKEDFLSRMKTINR